MATHSSTLAWNIPWMEKPGRLQSMGSQRSDMTKWLHFHFLWARWWDGHSHGIMPFKTQWGGGRTLPAGFELRATGWQPGVGGNTRTATHQAPLSMRFSRQGYRSGLWFPFLQGMFPTQGLNPGLLFCGQILYRLNYKGPVMVGAKNGLRSRPGFSLTLRISNLPAIWVGSEEHTDPQLRGRPCCSPWFQPEETLDWGHLTQAQTPGLGKLWGAKDVCSKPLSLQWFTI